jgi:putative methyltransferase (TIGR04325 family)
MIHRQLKSLLPPALLSVINNFLGRKIKYCGDYRNWSEAELKATGYDSDKILQQTLAATRKVLNGKAAYERDGVTFPTPAYAWPLLTSLLWIASRESNRLEILDFGGSLGSSYFQHKTMLEKIDLHWGVVEQTHFVAAGINLINDPQLDFYPSIGNYTENKAPQTVLLGSVLQYMEKPYQLLSDINDSAAQYLIIDRTPLSSVLEDKILVQKVPASINAASYPLWILSKRKLLESLTVNWQVITELPSPEGVASSNKGLQFSFEGMLLERKH